MADALVSAPVAAAGGLAALTLITIAVSKVQKDKRHDTPALMGVLGAFVFAAQMINFSIPGTGSSGHIIGGVLLSALLGPWAAFLVLCSVLIVQCFVFADGGMLVLGCNIINMAAMSCLVAYPLVYKSIARGTRHIMAAAVAACTVGLEAGAFLVTLQTEVSGITALPLGKFLMFMLPIHLAIGLCEGVATGVVLKWIHRYDPALLVADTASGDTSHKHTYLWMGMLTLLFAVAFTWIASPNPDGLEWSIKQMTGAAELGEAVTPTTAIMPDYESKLAGVAGGIITLAVVWGIASMIFGRRRRTIRVQ